MIEAAVWAAVRDPPTIATNDAAATMGFHEGGRHIDLTTRLIEYRYTSLSLGRKHYYCKAICDLLLINKSYCSDWTVCAFPLSRMHGAAT